MTEIDKAIDALRDERANRTAEIGLHNAQISLIDAEIRGMERARDLFGPPQAVDEPAPQRHSVQRPVMALFDQGEGNLGETFWTEDAIVGKTGLPTEAVHQFLLRATRSGMLRRRTNLVGSITEYTLPAKPVQEAAG